MQYRTTDLISALERTHGMIYLAAKELGCDPSTIYRRAEKDKKIRHTIDSFRGQIIDKAELKLETAVMNGEPWAITLALKTIGKNRGYVEKQEIESGGKVEIIVRHNDRAEPSHLTPEAEGDIPIDGETEDIS
jgi:hypothetical protein